MNVNVTFPTTSLKLSFMFSFYQHVHYLLDTITNFDRDIIYSKQYVIEFILFEIQPYAFYYNFVPVSLDCKLLTWIASFIL